MAVKMLATYRLSRHIASFEFFYWLVMVKAAGAGKIVFDISNPKTRKFPYEDVMERFRSIIEPGPAMAGMKYRYGNDVTPLDATASQLLNWYNAGGRFERLKSVKPAVKCEYTVTIRENPGAKSRNSHQEPWRQFAKEIGAIVIEDYYRQPIHLHDRMALYAGAKMNFGVCNGPMALLALTEHPVAMVVNTDSARNSNTRWGSKPDENFPWMLPNQHLIWKEDTIDNLRRTFDELCL